MDKTGKEKFKKRKKKGMERKLEVKLPLFCP